MLNASEDSLRVMVVDVCTHPKSQEVCVYGVLDGGEQLGARTVVVEVNDLFPYLYVEPRGEVGERDVEQFRCALEKELASDYYGLSKGDAAPAAASSSSSSSSSASTWQCSKCTLLNPTSAATCSACRAPAPNVITIDDSSDSDVDMEPPATSPIVNVELIRAHSIMYYRGDATKPFFKITVRYPKLVPLVRRALLETGKFPQLSADAFEANVEFTLRSMIDLGISGAGWIEVPAGSYSLRSPSDVSKRVELCIRLHSWRRPGDASPPRSVLRSFAANELHDHNLIQLAPLRILSVDIQCLPRPGQVLDPAVDSIASIATVLRYRPGQAPVSLLFYVDTSLAARQLDAPGTRSAYGFASERAMLEQWRQAFLCFDPDVVIGFEAGTHDWPFLAARAEACGLDDFLYLGRDPLVPSKLSKVQIYSAGWVRSKRRMSQISNQASGQLNMQGRVFFDMRKVIQSGHALRTYSLQDCCAELLHETEPFLRPPTLADLRTAALGQPPEAMAASSYARYAVRQALLPLLLMDKLATLTQTAELARVTGINMNDVFVRGQMVRTWSLLLRHTRTLGFVVPTVPRSMDQEGMTSGPQQFDPTVLGTTGLHEAPVTVCDFASLYPSIMIAYNLCYSTLLVKQDVGTLVPVERTHESPHTHDHYVKPEVRPGVLPQVLRWLVQARGQVKQLLKQCKAQAREDDSHAKRQLIEVLTQRQQALKVSANAVYGFTGSTSSRLVLAPLAEATINYGATLLVESAQWVQQQYPDARVIYGATDSLMIKCKDGTSVADAIAFGREVARRITSGLLDPMRFEFEKVYYPFLLQQNNHYAGVVYASNPDVHDRLDIKGMESVRRDIIPLVRRLLSGCLEHILVDRDLPRAIELTKATVTAVLSGKVDMSQLIVTRALARGTDSQQYAVKQAHVEVARRIAEREPGRSYQLGERVRYVFIRGTPDSRQHERSEDPLYVHQQGLPVDAQLYVKNMIRKPLVRLFELPGLLGSTARAEKELFTGAHMRIIKKSSRAGPSSPKKKGGIASMFASMAAKAAKAAEDAAPAATQSRKCAGCNQLLSRKRRQASDTNPHLCDRCLPQQDAILQRVLATELAPLEREHASLTSACHRCQGRFMDDVLCENVDCEVFWKLLHTSKAVTEVSERVAKLQW